MKCNLTIALKDDQALLHVMRALAYHSQETGCKGTCTKGTGYKEFLESGNQVTYKFTDCAFACTFINEAKRLMNEHWSIVAIDVEDDSCLQ